MINRKKVLELLRMNWKNFIPMFFLLISLFIGSIENLPTWTILFSLIAVLSGIFLFVRFIKFLNRI